MRTYRELFTVPELKALFISSSLRTAAGNGFELCYEYPPERWPSEDERRMQPLDFDALLALAEAEPALRPETDGNS